MEPYDEEERKSKGSACSPYWIVNSCLALVNGWIGRKIQISSAEEERAFQNELKQLREQYEDTKELMEAGFKRHLKDIQIANENIQSELKFNLELEKDELKMFVKGWPLKLALQKVQEKRAALKSLPETLLIIVAKHTGGTRNDILTQIYDGASGIVDNVQNTLAKVGIPDRDVLRFKEKDYALGGAALANIYSMLSAFPTVVILPRIDRLNKHLTISVGCWFAESRIPSQRLVLALDYDDNQMSMSAKYKAEKQKEIEGCYIAIAAVMNDIYSLLASGKTPQFPSFAKSIGLMDKYPLIKEFVRKEYSSLIDNSQTTVMLNGVECNAMEVLYSDDRRKAIRSEIETILNTVN